MAQVDLLLKNAIPTEVCNESVIEAVDSLNPYMPEASPTWWITVPLLPAWARKWGPRFDHLIEQEVFTAYDRTEQVDENRLQAFVQHPVSGPGLSEIIAAT